MEKAAEERSTRSFLKFMGIVGGEELRSMPLSLRSVRRLSWLTVNIVLNILAASVIAFHQDTLTAVIALAVFLPIISDMSGCSGNQAVAVSLRELTLGIIKPYEVWRVFRKESAIGHHQWNRARNSARPGRVGMERKCDARRSRRHLRSPRTHLCAVCFGGLIPLALTGLGQDPALASGPILTTITDMSGFFIVLKLASMVLPWLTTGSSPRQSKVFRFPCALQSMSRSIDHAAYDPGSRRSPLLSIFLHIRRLRRERKVDPHAARILP